MAKLFKANIKSLAEDVFSSQRKKPFNQNILICPVCAFARTIHLANNSIFKCAYIGENAR